MEYQTWDHMGHGRFDSQESDYHRGKKLQISTIFLENGPVESASSVPDFPSVVLGDFTGENTYSPLQ